MKPIFCLFFATTLLVTLTACATQAISTATPVTQTALPAITPSPAATTATGSSLFAIFEGITPCSTQSKLLPQIPEDSNCEQMIWKLTLHQDPTTEVPTTFELDSAYGLPKQGTQELQNGGTKISIAGKWAITKGTKTTPNAVVYQLESDAPHASLYFVKMGDDIIHILHPDRSMMVGNAAWSYTLNRTDNQPSIPTIPPGNMPDGPRPPTPTPPAGSSVLAVFEGRLPCHEIALKFTKVELYPGCIKIKTRLTLYHDQTTGAPTVYRYLGTGSIAAGTWTIVQGRNADSDAIIYQFQVDGDQAPVSFLKVDDNHLFLLDQSLNLLVGDASFSYTLSRKDAETP
jgi:hypothetical protein